MNNRLAAAAVGTALLVYPCCRQEPETQDPFSRCPEANGRLYRALVHLHAGCFADEIRSVLEEAVDVCPAGGLMYDPAQVDMLIGDIRARCAVPQCMEELGRAFETVRTHFNGGYSSPELAEELGRVEEVCGTGGPLCMEHPSLTVEFQRRSVRNAVSFITGMDSD